MRPSKKPKVIIVLGPPGSGKGTQASLLAEKLNLYHWETSKIINQMIEGAGKGDFVKVGAKKYYFLAQKKQAERGKLWDPPFVFYLIQKKAKELAREGQGIAMVGSPRTVWEGEKLIPFLKKLYGPSNVQVLLIQLSPKETIWRNSHRRECELARHPVLYTKETVRLKKCPFDGSRLIARKDDNPEVIQIRLEEYAERTFPVVEFFKKEKVQIKEVNGEQSVADVFSDVLKAVDR